MVPELVTTLVVEGCVISVPSPLCAVVPVVDTGSVANTLDNTGKVEVVSKDGVELEGSSSSEGLVVSKTDVASFVVEMVGEEVVVVNVSGIDIEVVS